MAVLIKLNEYESQPLGVYDVSEVCKCVPSERRAKVVELYFFSQRERDHERERERERRRDASRSAGGERKRERERERRGGGLRLRDRRRSSRRS